ncbi:MAG: LabA-like NYN domain-containing protein [Planctomycetota bacterium]|jgi:uncharacterized LabA/DUF88 family protein
MQKIAIFADIQNIYYTTREKFGCNFDYNAFWAEATEGKEVVSAFAYATGRGDEKQKQFQNILRGIGFEVKLKPFIERKDGSAKGDWDVGIALDVMEYAEKADVVILLSGDGDFDLLAERAIKNHGVSFEVYGVKDLTALSLIKAATRYRPIDGELLLR